MGKIFLTFIKNVEKMIGYEDADKTHPLISVIDQKCFNTALANRYQICVHTHVDFSMDDDRKDLVSSSACSWTNFD